jgi:hypothetical protein
MIYGEGIKFSFSDEVTPWLDKSLFEEIEKEINERASVMDPVRPLNALFW